jgi:hypothetical protein
MPGVQESNDDERDDAHDRNTGGNPGDYRTAS